MTQSTDEFRRETRVAIDAVKRALAIVGGASARETSPRKAGAIS